MWFPGPKTTLKVSAPQTLKGFAMYTPTGSRPRTGAALLLLVLLPVITPAQASAGTPAAPKESGVSAEYCPLTRIGTQLVRCDNLTGAGVPAPYWIPEQ